MKILEGKKLPYEIEHKTDKCIIHYDVDYSSGSPEVLDLAVEIDFCGSAIDITAHLKKEWPMRLEAYRRFAEMFYLEQLADSNKKDELYPDGPQDAA